MASVSRQQFVTVPVTTVWTSPSAPRDVDGWAVAQKPDMAAWLADLDRAGARAGLHGRVLTQLECCEPVIVTGDQGRLRTGSPGARWQQIVAPWQPSTVDERGYPGWVLAEHLGDRAPSCAPIEGMAERPGGADAHAFVAGARSHLGIGYLWGGLCDLGLDCSGLVHLSLRRLGVIVPRDADDQYDACVHILTEEAEPGDLFFFAEQGRRPHHVGIVTAPYRMIHAPQTGASVVEEHISPERRRTLVGAGRLPMLPTHTASAG
jgi:gamma-D-glutamyl-L-lysine dipeptidyl-peptidase